MKKLYEVSVKMMVFAESEDVKYVTMNVLDNIDTCNFEAKRATKCLPGWEDSFPFGDMGSADITCAELIENPDAYEGFYDDY